MCSNLEELCLELQGFHACKKSRIVYYFLQLSLTLISREQMD